MPQEPDAFPGSPGPTGPLSPSAKPPVTTYAVFPTYCLSLFPCLLPEPAVGLLRLGRKQGLRNQINR